MYLLYLYILLLALSYLPAEDTKLNLIVERTNVMPGAFVDQTHGGRGFLVVHTDGLVHVLNNDGVVVGETRTPNSVPYLSRQYSIRENTGQIIVCAEKSLVSHSVGSRHSPVQPKLAATPLLVDVSKTGLVFSIDADNNLSVFDFGRSKSLLSTCKLPFEKNEVPKALRVNADETKVIVGTSARKCYVLECFSDEIESVFDVKVSIADVAINSSGTPIITSFMGDIIAYDDSTKTMEILASQAKLNEGVGVQAFISRNGNFAVSNNGDGDGILLSTMNPKSKIVIENLFKQGMSRCISNDGTKILSVCFDGCVYVFEQDDAWTIQKKPNNLMCPESIRLDGDRFIVSYSTTARRSGLVDAPGFEKNLPVRKIVEFKNSLTAAVKFDVKDGDAQFSVSRCGHFYSMTKSKTESQIIDRFSRQPIAQFPKVEEGIRHFVVTERNILCLL